MSDAFRAWLRQPSTITGIGALVGVTAAAVAGYLSGSQEAGASVGIVVAAAVHLIMPDNSALAALAAKAAADVVEATPGGRKAVAAAVAADAPGIVEAVMTAGGKAAPVLALVGLLGLGACSTAQEAKFATETTAVVAEARQACAVEGVVVIVDPAVIEKRGATADEVCAFVRAVPAPARK